MKIRPISDLRNYPELISEVREDEPVYLTKNGRERCALVDISYVEEYEQMKKQLSLMNYLNEGIESAEKDGWIDFDKASKEWDDLK